MVKSVVWAVKEVGGVDFDNWTAVERKEQRKYTQQRKSLILYNKNDQK